MPAPKDLLYTKEHEWVRIEGKLGTVGITDHAQHALGDITFADLPAVGKVVKQSESMATVESVKAASDVYAPVSGYVVKRNDALTGAPETINKAPYGDGWFIVIELSDINDKAKLLTPDAYDKYLEESH